MKIRLACPIQSDSIVDGPGLRAVIWTQGCKHNCKGCHNPSTHSFDGGFLKDVEEIKKEIDKLTLIDGITLSGGDPLFQVKECLEIVLYAKKRKLNVWVYTGFTFEQLIKLKENKKEIKEFLENIDVLVDGKFEIENKKLSLNFRGSTNQRIINVKKSLKENKVCIYKKYDNTEVKKVDYEHVYV